MASLTGDLEVNDHAAERYLLRFKDDFGPYSKGTIRTAAEELKAIFRTSKKSKYVRPIPHVTTSVYEGRTSDDEIIWLMVDGNILYTVMTDFGYVSRWKRRADGTRYFCKEESNIIKLDKPARSGIDSRHGKRRRR
jgi:hypothetical protein